MTYLGVNYYLTGLHSYGSGSASSFPYALVVVIVLVGGIIWKAYNNLSVIDVKED